MSNHNAGNAPRALPAPPIRWDSLSADAEQRELTELGMWVDRLVVRYELDSRTVPPCWREHGTLIEELSALRTGWLSSFALTAAGNAPLAWHAAFHACRLRLTDYNSRTGCTSSRHRPNTRYEAAP